MPFVTEELYQRLPRRKNDEIPSIVIAQYPLPEQVFIPKAFLLIFLSDLKSEFNQIMWILLNIY